MRKFFSKLSESRIRTHSRLLKCALNRTKLIHHLEFLEENLKYDAELATARMKMVRLIINDLESL